MDRTTVTANVKPLERRGLVKVRVDREDRRNRRLELTPSGQALLAAAAPIWQRAHAATERRLRSSSPDILRASLDDPRRTRGSEFGLNRGSGRGRGSSRGRTNVCAPNRSGDWILRAYATMSFIRLYLRVLDMLAAEARLGWMLALANLALAVAQFAEPVLFGRIIDALVRRTGRDAPAARPDAAARRLGRFRAVHHRLRRAGRAARRPARAPPPAGRADQLFRARAAASALLSRRHAFGPADEGDAHRHRRAVGAVAVVLPRALRGLRLAVRAAAAVAVHQLAARDPAADACAWSSRADRARHPQDRTLQRTVESHYTDLAERASDALGNVALVQGFARVEAEVSACADGRPRCSPRRCRCSPGGRWSRC